METSSWSNVANETIETSSWSNIGNETMETSTWSNIVDETMETSSWSNVTNDTMETGSVIPPGCLVLNIKYEYFPWDNPDNVITQQQLRNTLKV
jgi:hypothetical protein